MPLTVAFWIVAGLTALLLGAWALSRGTDAASRGIGQAYALVGLPFLALGVLVFLLSRGPALRGVALVVAAVPLLALLAMAANARFGYLLDDYLKSPAHLFASTPGRDLGRAIEAHDLPRIRQLAAGGADLAEIGKDGRSPLAFALDRGALDAAAVLVDLGADPTRGEGEGGHAPIVEMANADARADLLRQALAHGASPDYADKWGVPLVHWAITSRARTCLRVLIEGKARLDVRDDTHQLASPLSTAVDRRLWDYALVLVEHGAPVKEAPGWNGLDVRFANASPPAPGDGDRADYDRLLAAMTARGFVAAER
jgi:hypothetical protein